MRRNDPRLLCALAVATLAACGDNLAKPPGWDSTGEGSAVPATDDFVEARYPGEPGKPRVLVYTFENAWHGYTVITTNHPLAINAKTLAEVDVIVFCVTSGSGLTASGKADLEAWIRAGGGVVGFHSATFTEPLWPFYVSNVGTGFAGHAGGLWPATVTLLSSTHPITAGLPDLQLTDEWYFFSQRPETIPGAQMLFALDETTLPPEFPAVNKQGFHAIGWTNDRYGGRMFYSAFGHNPATFDDPNVLEIVARAIEWAAHQR
jgi:type 1 glutamine amidotransferase